MIRDLYQSAMAMSLDEDIAADIVNKVIKSYSVRVHQKMKLRKALLEPKIRDYQFGNSETTFLFQKIIFFFRRDYLHIKNSFDGVSRFESLSWLERLFSILVYSMHLSSSEVKGILNIGQSDYLNFCQRAESTLIQSSYEKPKNESKLFDLGYSDLRAKVLGSYERRVGIKRAENSFEVRRSIPLFPVCSGDSFQFKNKLINILTRYNQ